MHVDGIDTIIMHASGDSEQYHNANIEVHVFSALYIIGSCKTLIGVYEMHA